MALFAISDLHLSLSADKPMDIFRGWENYVERLEKNWRAVITDADTVILPGDLSWAMKLEDALEDFSFVDKLPGQKYLLKGNHDLWWTTAKKMTEFFSQNGLNTLHFLHNNCVTAENVHLCGTRGWLYDEDKYTENDAKILNREAMRLRASLQSAPDDGKERVVFLHYPPVYGNTRCEPILAVLREFGVKRCYYGHIHGSGAALAINEMRENIRFRLVSCDFNDFSPVLVG